MSIAPWWCGIIEAAKARSADSTGDASAACIPSCIADMHCVAAVANRAPASALVMTAPAAGATCADVTCADVACADVTAADATHGAAEAGRCAARGAPGMNMTDAAAIDAA